MGSALFKTFVSTVSLSPATFIRHLNRGWRQVLLACGTIEIVSLEARSGVIRLRELPAACLASSAWVGALVPGMRILDETVQVKGDVTVARRRDDIELRRTW